jgi:hypothetical protein
MHAGVARPYSVVTFRGLWAVVLLALGSSSVKGK